MKIGLLVGMEESFPRAFLARAAELEGVEAELLRVGAVVPGDAAGCDVLLDRISHEVPYFRAVAAAAALAGARVVNGPFRPEAGGRFLALATARALGIAVPPSALLPQKDYAPTVTEASLRNLEYPLPWQGILGSVGTPARLRSAGGSGLRTAPRVTDLPSLLAAYDSSGDEPMILEKEVRGEPHVRCLVAGDSVLASRFDPEHRLHLVDPAALPAPLEERLIRESVALAKALGLDLAAIEFAVDGGVPVLSGVEAVPELEESFLGPFAFDRAVALVLDLCVAVGSRAPAPGVAALRPAPGGLVAVLRDAGPPPAPRVAAPKRPVRSRRGGRGRSAGASS